MEGGIFEGAGDWEDDALATDCAGGHHRFFWVDEVDGLSVAATGVGAEIHEGADFVGADVSAEVVAEGV